MRDVGVGRVVAAALGQVAGSQADERQQQERRGHHEPPALLAEVGQRQRHQAQAGAEAHRPPPATRTRTRATRRASPRPPTMPTSTPPAVAAPRTSVCATPSDTRSGRQRRQRRRAGSRLSRRGAAPAGARADRRGSSPPAHRARRSATSDEHRALVGLAGVELVGRERDRLRQQRADEPEDEREVAERPERGARRGGRAPPAATTTACARAAVGAGAPRR